MRMMNTNTVRDNPIPPESKHDEAIEDFIYHLQLKRANSETTSHIEIELL